MLTSGANNPNPKLFLGVFCTPFKKTSDVSVAQAKSSHGVDARKAEFRVFPGVDQSGDGHCNSAEYGKANSHARLEANPAQIPRVPESIFPPDYR